MSNVNRIYANKIDYITYLLTNPELPKKIGSKLLLPSAAIMNFMLFKACYGASEEAKKKNLVYLNSIYTFLEHLPQELVIAAVKKLLVTGQIIRSDRDNLQISNEIAKYFYGLTEIETFNTLDTSETSKKDKTVKTDNSWSNLASLKCFRNQAIKDMFEKQKLGDDDFKTNAGQKDVMRALVFGCWDLVIANNLETSFFEDVNSMFAHFGVEKTHVKKLYEDTKGRYLDILKRQKEKSENRL